MIRRIIHIDEENATDVVRVRLPATRAQSEWLTAKRSFCVTIIATDLVTVCQPVRPVRSHS